MLRPSDSIPVEKYEPGKLIVQFKPEAEDHASRAQAAAGMKVLNQIPELNTQLISVEIGKEMEWKDRFLALDNVAYAEPNYYRYSTHRPNDRFYTESIQTSRGLTSQWGLCRINPEGAWERARELPATVKVAVIDSGIDPTHPELAGKIANPTNLYTSNPNDFTDQDGHGTMAAGIIAALTDNAAGIAGASLNTATILPVRVGNGFYTTYAVIRAIAWAVQQGANILQMSFGSGFYSHFEQQALEFAWNRGLVIVAAVGNSGNEQVNYPAGYAHVLGVATTGPDDRPAPFTSWGIDVGIAAPGVAILSTTPTYPVPGSGYLSYDAADGTSFAAPFVSGVAALLLALDPALTNEEVVRILQKSARAPLDAPAGEEDPCSRPGRSWDPFMGYGILDASAAARLALECPLCEEGLGSFYGQVLSLTTGLPVASATVYALRAGEVAREYQTRDNVVSGAESIASDGMFRLMNLPQGDYDICVGLPGQTVRRLQSAAVSPGADVVLMLKV